MTACPTHGALLGGFVLGSLEPAEMEEMRRHVADCPYCGPEARALGVLPSLLDSITTSNRPFTDDSHAGLSSSFMAAMLFVMRPVRSRS